MPNAASQPSLVLLTLIAFAAGCGPAERPIVPDSAVGRRALDAAMSAWKAGRPPGPLDLEGPDVQVVDSFRRPGQALLSYQIVSETADNRIRAFTLQLEFDGGATETARFFLVGIDPFLVFREQDYDLLTHFEHKMDASEVTGK